MIKSKDGKDKVPEVFFRAEDSAQEELKSDSRDPDLEAEEGEEEGSDEQMVDGKIVKLGKIESGNKVEVEKKQEQKESLEDKLRGGEGQGGVESYSGQGREGEFADKDTKFVRWSSSTEIGDFIRDAARGKEFEVEIEGASKRSMCLSDISDFYIRCGFSLPGED